MSFRLNQTTEFELHQTFRRYLAVPSVFLAMPGTWPELYMPILTDSSEVGLGAGPTGGYDFSVDSNYEFRFSPAPIYESLLFLLLVHRASLYSSSAYDTLVTHA